MDYFYRLLALNKPLCKHCGYHDSVGWLPSSCIHGDTQPHIGMIPPCSHNARSVHNEPFYARIHLHLKSQFKTDKSTKIKCIMYLFYGIMFLKRNLYITYECLCQNV